MSSPLNVLWKKEESDSDLYINIFSQKDHEIDIKHKALMYRLTKGMIEAPRGLTMALLYRHEGKTVFESGDMQHAMFVFNAGLISTSVDCQERGIAYANRSMCFLRLDMPEKALIDIELAKQFNYPTNLHAKLNARASKCKQLLADEEYISKRFTPIEPMLSFDEHKQHAGVADCLEIQLNDKFGYHVITNHDLKVGQTVLVEPAYAITPKRLENISRDHCWTCYKDMQNFIPCEKNSLYCNDDCIAGGSHKYDCSLPTFSRKETYDLVPKIIYTLIDAFPDVDMLMATVNTLLNGDEVIGLTNDVQKNFCTLFRLIHKHELKPDQQSKFLEPAADSLITLVQVPCIKELFNDKTKHRFLTHLILHLHHVTDHAFALHEYKQLEDDEIYLYTFLQYASAMYPFGCYIKHSCAPNVCWYPIDNRLVCKVIRPIKKGEQIFRSYHPATETFQMDNEMVVSQLEERYNFKCKCARCMEIKSNDKVEVWDDPLYRECLTFFEDIKIKDFRKMSRETVEQHEKKTIELVEKYCDGSCSESDLMTMQEHLQLIWILRSQHF